MRDEIRDATNQAPPLTGHNVVTSDLALAEAVVRHADESVLTSLEAYRDSYRFRQLIEPAALLEPRFQLNRQVLESRLAEQRWLVEG